MYIRSQDRKCLLPVDRLFITKYDKWEIVADLEDSSLTLGYYKTKEKAMAVLDEIDLVKFYNYLAKLDYTTFKRIIEDNNAKDIAKIYKSMSTYEMPEDEEE